jgi:signal transduction histidine kinase
MRSRSWLVLSIGFGTLVILIAVLGVGAMRRARAIHNELVATHLEYLKADTLVRELPADLYFSSVLIRDYLLDPSEGNASWYQEQLKRQRLQIQEKLVLLRHHLGPAQGNAMNRLQKEVDAYWKSLEPVFAWTPEQKAQSSRFFLRTEVLPRREAVADLAREITLFNGQHLAAEQQRLQVSQNLFQDFIRRLLTFTLLVGLLVSLASILRVNRLERLGDEQRTRAESAEHEMRQLSRKLVQAQELERKSLSRELHDAVGQMLSSIGMELGTVESLVAGTSEKCRERLAEAQRLVTETIRTVRDLAMGLRPAMLDELGLASAIRWQSREFSRRYGVPVDVQLDGDVEGLPETHRTSVYRIVQEALTNCSRHAQAKHIRIRLYGRKDWLSLIIQDDGIGFDPVKAQGNGLGLLGIQERVRELGGTTNITSTPARGTIVEIHAPVSVTETVPG